jgi:hypothetical protein
MVPAIQKAETGGSLESSSRLSWAREGDPVSMKNKTKSS